ncbi:Kinesin light chain [Gossypium arboreum]|uniref:Kinesin light chain n=1 Tax=Gossypium arboreum TaxID=29729 RepID=A0A0B0NKC9_GOSAR|nr:Kinesin light chain [Gossypium arboreum]
MSLHVLAAIYSSLGRFEEAVPVLERSSEVPLLGNESDHALAKFSGCMQLGDTYSMMGQLDRSINSYESGLRIQIEALGDSYSRTCRYLAEAHVQVVQFDEAESPARRPSKSTKSTVHQDPLKKQLITSLWLLCEAKGDYGSALQHLVRASMSMIANDLMRQSLPIRRHLTVFKSTKGESHPSLASVFIRLAGLYNKTGKLRESKFYSENAFRIYSKQVPGTTPEEIAEALKLLEMAMKLLEDTHGNISIIARIEAQMGGMFYLVGRYGEV